MRRVFVAAAAAAALSLATAGTATAHKVTYESTIQLKIDAISDTVNQYSGRVVSERSRCESGRDVEVSVAGATIATAVTLLNGDWSVQATPRPVKGTTVIALTPRKFLKRSKRHRHKCASDFSERRAP